MSSTRSNTIYNIAYRVFSIFLPIVTEPYLARTVGTAGVGMYGYTWSISYIFCLIAMLGLENYGTRAIAQARGSRSELNRTFSGIWKMQLMVAGVMLAAWLVYAGMIAGEEQLIALHLTMMSVSCLVNVDWCLMGLDAFRPIALRSTCVKLIAAACVFLFVKSPQDLWIYAFSWSAATLIGCLLCWPVIRRHVSLVPVSRDEILSHLKPCALLSVSVLAVSVYRQMDKIMLGAMCGMSENGLYTDAEKIIYCLSGFISAIGTVMLPGASAMAKKKQIPALHLRMIRTMEIILCMTCAMAFGLAAVAERFAPLFYGEDFAASGTLMIPLGFTLVMIGFANVVRTQWVLPTGQDRILVRSVLCGAAVNLIVNWLMIPHFRGMGAVIGTLCAEMSVPLVQWIFLRREIPYKHFFRLLGCYMGIGAVMYTAVRLLDRLPLAGWTGLAVLACSGAAIYGALCLILWRHAGHRHMYRLLRFGKKRRNA